MSYAYSAHYSPRPPLLNSRNIWGVAILLAIALHLISFFLPIDWVRRPQSTPVSVQTINPAQLAQIRKSWKQLAPIVDARPDQAASQTAPENARYISDRNLRVEREQRARSGENIPRFGGDTAQTRARAKPIPPARPLPDLADLGVPLRRPRTPREVEADRNPQGPEAERATRAARNPNKSPAEQWIHDPSLSEGSETMLNAVESVNYSFINRLREQIAPNYGSRVRSALQSGQIRLGQGTHEVQAKIELDPDGKLLDVSVIHSSGDAAFDDVVVRVWRMFDRYPNPPKGLIKDGRVTMVWNFGLDLSPQNGWNFSDPTGTWQ